ncbi:MAG: hemolysin family protein [Lachnospiraceae bacterium]
MDSSIIIGLITIIILVILSAFFSSAETALTTVNKHRLRALSEEGNKRATLVLRVTEDPGKMLSAILIGNNIVNLSASSLATTLTANILQALGFGYLKSMAGGISTGVLTLIVLVFGEISPKTMATIHSEKLSLLYIPIISALTTILTPIIFLINQIANLFLRILGVDTNQNGSTMTEKELRTIVDVSREDGVIKNEEHEIINNVFDFGSSLAKDIMQPRVDMVFASVDSSYDELVDIFLKDQYSRLPIYEDSKDNVIGILYLKDLFFYRVQNQKKEFNIKEVLREPFFTYEHQKTSVLMKIMREEAVSFAIVLDEYGSTAGLITIEDLLEEIVGDVRDEFDADELEAIKCIGPNTYEVDGTLKIDDLNDAIGTSIESEDYTSIGGHMIELLDHLPVENDAAIEGNILYKVLSIHKNRIERLFIQINDMDENSNIKK